MKRKQKQIFEIIAKGNNNSERQGKGEDLRTLSSSQFPKTTGKRINQASPGRHGAEQGVKW
jgi:hypothetical protein